MNTKFTFYITHISYGQFEKTVFTVILEGAPFQSQSNAQDWIANNIDELMNLADASTVIDHVVMHYANTKETIKSLEIVDTIIGKLTFNKPIKVTTKPEIKSEPIKVTKPEPKSQPSGWIDTAGKQYDVGFSNHNEFASEYLASQGYTTDELYCGNEYPYEKLQKLGWVRILGWTDPVTFYIECALTTKQRKAIKDYCQANSCDLPAEMQNY